MWTAKQDADVFPLAAFCLLAENSHRGHRLPTAALHRGFTPINSNTATGFQAFLYDSGRRSRSTGKERDAETGLDFFGARYFSGAQGRFTTADWSAKPEAVPYSTLEDPQTLNLYSYVRNNPMARADADGHCAEPASCAVEFGAAGTAVAGPIGGVAGAVLGGAIGGVIVGLAGPKVVEAASQALAASGGTACGELYCSGSVPFMSSNSQAGNPKDVYIDPNKYPASAGHAADAQATGQPDVLTVDRGGASGRRSGDRRACAASGN
jgi:RHS repeat-associated protein